MTLFPGETTLYPGEMTLHACRYDNTYFVFSEIVSEKMLEVPIITVNYKIFYRQRIYLVTWLLSELLTLRMSRKMYDLKQL